MRGFEAEELIGHNGITKHDISPFIYPSEEEIERVGVIGHYLSNFFNWEGKAQGEKVIEEWDFKPVTYPRERTFFQYAKIEDHANDVHDYLKYLKFGYGRATDDPSMEIRHGTMTREEGMEMVKKYDHVKSSDIYHWLNYVGKTEHWFDTIADTFRNPNTWRQEKNGEWRKMNIWDEG